MDYGQVRNLARKYEELGFTFVAPFDHFIPIYSEESAEFMECWSLLGAIAMETSRIKIGPLVTCASYRNPAIVAKMASTLDVISKGRFFLGVGLGWYRKEFESYGIPFMGFSERLRQLEEFTRIVRTMWTDHSVTFAGRYFSVNRALNYPKPIQKPHPPILIGSEKGSERMLRLMCEYADIANIGFNTPCSELSAKVRLMKRICREMGRDPKRIVISTNMDLLMGRSQKEVKEKIRATYTKFRRRWSSAEEYLRKIDHGIIGTPEECGNILEEVRKTGVALVFLQPLDSPDLRSIELFAQHFI